MKNGIYMIADTPRSAIPLATEGGGGDEALLIEALEEEGYEVSKKEEKDA